MKIVQKLKFFLILSISCSILPHDAIISLFLHKYPYFKSTNSGKKKFDPSSVSKKLTQPGYLYRKITQPAHYHRAVPGIMVLYDGHIALSDDNGQVIFPRRQQTSKIYLLISKEIQPAYIIAPATIHNWVLKIKHQSDAQNYLIEFKQDNDLGLYYFDVQPAPLPHEGNIPLNTIILIADPQTVYVPTGATLTQYSPNLMLPDIFIKRDFCFVHNELYSLAIKQYFEQSDRKSILDNLTIIQSIA